MRIKMTKNIKDSRFNLRLPKKLVEDIKKILPTDVSFAALIRALLRDYVENHKK